MHVASHPVADNSFQHTEKKNIYAYLIYVYIYIYVQIYHTYIYTYMNADCTDGTIFSVLFQASRDMTMSHVVNTVLRNLESIFFRFQHPQQHDIIRTS